jgi:hypothetical protein
MGALSISNPVITTLILVQLLRRFVLYWWLTNTFTLYRKMR